MNREMSRELEYLILDSNKIDNNGLIELSNALLHRKKVLNNYMGQENIPDTVIMPLLQFSMADTNITDQGLYHFIKKLEAIHNDQYTYFG